MGVGDFLLCQTCHKLATILDFRAKTSVNEVNAVTARVDST